MVSRLCSRGKAKFTELTPRAAFRRKSSSRRASRRRSPATRIRYDHLDHPIGIDFLDLRNGATRRVLTVNMPQRFSAPGLAVSPDGKWLLYGLFDFEDDIMLFEDFR